MKTAKPKPVARRYWCHPAHWHEGRVLYLWNKKAKAKCDSIPVAVLDLRPEAVERAVEAIRNAIGMSIDRGGWCGEQKPYEHHARSALEALVGKLPK